MTSLNNDGFRAWVATHLFSFILIAITAIFTSGATYTTVQGNIEQNKEHIVAVDTRLSETRSDFTQRLDRIENKLDDINEYLRSLSNANVAQGKVISKTYQDYLIQLDKYIQDRDAYVKKYGLPPLSPKK